MSQDETVFDYSPVQTNVLVSRYDKNHVRETKDILAQEVAVGLVYNGIAHVVMMCSPTQLDDFALGFSMTEDIIDSPKDIRDISINPIETGIELNITISPRSMAALKHKRRNLSGRTGCGLCGAESLEQVLLPIEPLTKGKAITDIAIQKALTDLQNHQPLQAQTGAHHGAAWCDQDGNIIAVCEDIGRHNALDKLIGYLYRTEARRSEGFVLVSSRASYEMVQKVAKSSIPTLVSVSAPTALALRIAKQANLQLVGFARENRHVRYNN